MSSLLSLLDKIQQHCQQLLQCLKSEKKALQDSQLEQLSDLTQHKQTMLDQLQQLDQQRSDFFSGKDFNQFIKDSQDVSLKNQWQTTRDLLAECQQQNEVNGRLLIKSSQINQDILCMLTGRDLPDDETYNAEGNQSTKDSLLHGVKA